MESLSNSWLPALLLFLGLCLQPSSLVSIEEYLGSTETETIQLPVHESNIRFYLYTRAKPYGFRLFRGNLRNLHNSGFNPVFPTKLLIHGYMNNVTSDAIALIRDAYLSVGVFNIIGVDWSLYTFPYIIAVGNTRPVGHVIGRMVEYLLLEGGMRHGDLHVVGHSLGAHVAAFTGEQLSTKLSRITGLDPAAPLFADSPSRDRLGPEDAYSVDVIHTSVRFLGMTMNVGHLDFYPAGGKHQPRCTLDIIEEVIGACDHGESYRYFAETIVWPNKYRGTKCRSLNAALGTTCQGGTRGIMGDESIYHTVPGIYYVDVNFLRASNFDTEDQYTTLGEKL